MITTPSFILVRIASEQALSHKEKEAIPFFQ